MSTAYPKLNTHAGWADLCEEALRVEPGLRLDILADLGEEPYPPDALATMTATNLANLARQRQGKHL